jgi:hypothetical protein
MRARITPQSLLAMGTLATALVTPGQAQSESELRQEGARHAQQIQDLEAEVAALRDRVMALEKMIEEMRAAEVAGEQPDNTPEVQTKPEPKPTPPPKVGAAGGEAPPPLESPATLLAKMRSEFDDTLLKDPSFILGINSPDERAQKEAHAVLASWVERMNRIYKKPITWPVKILKVLSHINGDVVYTLQVISPDGSPAGQPFLQPASARIARRVASWRVQPDLSKLILKGVLEPRLTTIEQRNQDREINSEVVFDDGAIEVNAWVRFDFTVRLSSIMPIFVQPNSKTTPTETPGGP